MLYIYISLLKNKIRKYMHWAKSHVGSALKKTRWLFHALFSYSIEESTCLVLDFEPIWFKNTNCLHNHLMKTIWI
jgi:hypothetical protein